MIRRRGCITTTSGIMIRGWGGISRRSQWYLLGGHISLYPYCLDNPVNCIDPKGDIVFLLAGPAFYTAGMALTDLAIIGALGWGAQQVLKRVLNDIDRNFKSGCEEDYSKQNVLEQVLL